MNFRPRRAWRVTDWLMLGGLLVLAAFLMLQSLKDIATIGINDTEQSHIFLAPLIAVWLLWLRRPRLRHVLVQPSLIGPLIVLMGWLISWWGFTAGIQIFWHAGTLLVFVGILMSFTGLLPLYLFAPVFGVLLFVLPVPGVIRHMIALPMQEFATSVSYSVLELLGVPAIKTGNVLVINGQSVAVGEACNGMRMIFALTLVVYAFAFSTPFKPVTRVLLLVISPFIAILCNIIRLVPTSLIYGYGDPDFAHDFHDIAGWFMLPVAVFILMTMLRTLRWLDFPVNNYRLASQ